MNWILDYFLGPRNWMVVQWQGGFVETPISDLWPAANIVKSGLREGAAENMARRLKEQARDKPDQISGVA